MSKTKFVRVAVEGATSDGRIIERSWIEQMAASYNPETYAARVWLEHLRGIMPDGPFCAYGDVIAVKTETVKIDGKEKLALLAQIDATDALVAIVKARQKLYTSIEVNPSFADSNQAYLVGLAVTDSPASLGTEMLSFNAQSHVLDSRKQSANNLFTAAAETSIEFAEENAEASLLETIKALFTAREAKPKEAAAIEQGDERITKLHAAVEVCAAETQRIAAALNTCTQKIQSQLDDMQKTLQQHNQATPAGGYTARLPATGSENDKQPEGY